MTSLSFTPLNELERLLVEAANNPAARPDFYRTLLDTDLILLATVDPAAVQNGVTTQETPIQVLTWMKGEEPIVPIFSAVERLQEAVADTGTEFPYVIMQGAMLFPALAQGNLNVVLNPRCVVGKEFVVQEMRDLVEGKIMERLAAEQSQQPRQVALGTPAEHPTELVDGLRMIFRNHDAIEAAYLAQIFDPASGAASHLLVGMQASGDIVPAMNEAGGAVDQLLPAGVDVEFVLMDGGEIDGYLISQTTPFYVKGEEDDAMEYEVVGDETDDEEEEIPAPPVPPAAASETHSTASAPGASTRSGAGSEKQPWWKVWSK
jgi:hypothetical protein